MTRRNPYACRWIDCHALARSRGLCPAHYDRTIRAGRRTLRRYRTWTA